MATEPRLKTLLDDTFCLVRAPSRRPSLQLPPLQDPTPSRLSLRPLPLEPNTVANGQAHAGTSKLSPAHATSSKEVQSGLNKSQRQKDAKFKIGEKPKTGSPGCDQALLQPVTKSPLKEDGLFEVDEVCRPRKRQKVDTSHSTNTFVQLPRPTEKKKKPAKVPTIAALNELKTQLSNAGHFPPIAFLASDDEDNDGNQPASLDTRLNLAEQNKAPIDLSSYQKRPCKQRRKWTEQETEDLLQGVALHGVGNWKAILEDSRFKFDARSSVDLKDRFRTCCPNEYGMQMKFKSVHPGKNHGRSQALPSKPSNSSRSGALQASEGQPSSTNSSVPTPSQDLRPGVPTSPSVSIRSHRIKPEDLVRLGIDGPFPKSKRRERRAFTEEEDQHLLRGYMAYGPTWSRIREDPSLNLRTRRAIDLRDRFRNRFPEKYAEAGFKLRPKDWPGPPPRSGKKTEQAEKQGSSSPSPSPDGSGDTPKAVEDQPEVQAEPMVVQDEDLSIPSINSLLDWDDNTLPPFLTNANGGDSDMQNLLLDHIQPLLTYDPPRSYDSNNFSNNKFSLYDLPVIPRY